MSVVAHVTRALTRRALRCMHHTISDRRCTMGLVLGLGGRAQYRIRNRAIRGVLWWWCTLSAAERPPFTQGLQRRRTVHSRGLEHARQRSQPVAACRSAPACPACSDRRGISLPVAMGCIASAATPPVATMRDKVAQVCSCWRSRLIERRQKGRPAGCRMGWRPWMVPPAAPCSAHSPAAHSPPTTCLPAARSPTAPSSGGQRTDVSSAVHLAGALHAYACEGVVPVVAWEAMESSPRALP